MKLYAIRDKLLDYFKDPFPGHNDLAVKGAIAQMINGDGDNDIIQAPHHFEVWRIAEVNEQGRVTESREYLAECAALVRRDLREGTNGGSGPTGRLIETGAPSPAGTGRGTSTGPGALPDTPPGQAVQSGGQGPAAAGGTGS